jgi:hypothetical protein
MDIQVDTQAVDLLHDAVEAAIGRLSEQIAGAGLPDRAVLRERRLRLRSISAQLSADESR